MRNVTLTKKQTSEQHVELDTSRCNREFEYFMVFYNWCEKFDPFDTTNSGLKSLATGLTAKDNSEINCGNAESIVHTLQQSIDNLPITEAKIAVRKKIKTLVSLTVVTLVNLRVIIVADDKDILVLLMYFWNSEMGDIILQSMSKNKENMVYIRNVVSHLNKTVVKNFLLIHTWGGYDTTSSVFNQGKNAILNLIEKENPEVLEICGIFNNPSATQDDIGKAGITFFTVMYGMVCLLCFSIRIFNVFQTNASAYSRKACENSGFLMFSVCVQKSRFICLKWFKVSHINRRFY